jgi:D-alanyl-lipoteichoic acid acyltransferase DltB (MBOAT superfamily)
MLFNSYEYFIFLPLVFTLYWAIRGRNWELQNVILLIASYIFYGWWDYRFLSLLLFTTAIDYWAALKIEASRGPRLRRFYISLSVFINLGTLFLFKYYNFFLDSFISLTGSKLSDTLLISIVLPVGISFYTFQTMSYTLDVYFGNIKPSKSFIAFATFVIFFPQLVAGPIEKAQHLLPQMAQRRIINRSQIYSGLKLILWGLFKKVVVADSLAPFVEQIFNDNGITLGGSLWIGAFFFAVQVYCDFSGYSDIAIGSAKLFGIELMSNFKFPFFSRNFVEFWQRWHISLNNWFKSYVFTFLSNNFLNGKLFHTVIKVFIIFILSGLWHGANWTFVVWGFISWVIFLPSFFINKTTRDKSKKQRLVGFRDFPLILINFTLFAWSSIFFRSKNLKDAIEYNVNLFTSVPKFNLESNGILFYLFILLIIEWTHRADEREPLSFENKWLERWVLFVIFLFTFINFGKNTQEFIYFSF